MVTDMGTILDNKRAELDARIIWVQEEIDRIKAKAQKEIQVIQASMVVDVEKREVEFRRWQEQRHELEGYEPAADPNGSDD
jgi:vacuolar-type H+-ATPase subunit D/Vma8